MLSSTHCDSIQASIYTFDVTHADSLFLYGQPLVIHVPSLINMKFYNLALNHTPRQNDQ